MSTDVENNEVNRRTFLMQLAALGVGTSVLSSCSRMMSSGGAGASAGANMIGLQLYTVRDLLEKDFEGTLERVAQIGYTNMEFAGYYNRTPEQVRAVLDRHGEELLLVGPQHQRRGARGHLGQSGRRAGDRQGKSGGGGVKSRHGRSLGGQSRATAGRAHSWHDQAALRKWWQSHAVIPDPTEPVTPDVAVQSADASPPLDGLLQRQGPIGAAARVAKASSEETTWPSRTNP